MTIYRAKMYLERMAENRGPQAPLTILPTNTANEIFAHFNSRRNFNPNSAR